MSDEARLIAANENDDKKTFDNILRGFRQKSLKPKIQTKKFLLRQGWEYDAIVFLDTTFLTEGKTARCCMESCEFNRCKFQSVFLIKCEFNSSVFRNTSINHSKFLNCYFDNCKFDNITIVTFAPLFERGSVGHIEQILFEPIRKFLGLNRIKLNGTFRSAEFKDFELDDVDFGRSIIPIAGKLKANFESAQHVELARFAPPGDYWFSWGAIRFLGSLPLFGVSYFGIIAIWILVASASALSEIGLKIENGLETGGTGLLDKNALVFARFLQELEGYIATRDTAYTFTALLILAVTSTVYRLRCPSQIQESSLSTWMSQWGQVPSKYRVLSYRNRWARYACCIGYLTSVPWLIWLLLWRIVETLEILYLNKDVV